MGIFGFISIDMIAFPDPYADEEHPLFWVNSISCHYSNLHSVLSIGQPAARQREDIDDGLVGLENQQPRVIAGLPFVSNNSLPALNLRSFFHLARLDSMFFDVTTRKGIVFLLSDTLQCGALGIISIGVDQEKTYDKLLKCLGFIRKQSTGKRNEKYNSVFSAPRGDTTDFNEIYGGVKSILKNLKSILI